MSHILPFCLIIVSFTMIAAAAVEEDGRDGAANAREATAIPSAVKNFHAVSNRKIVGSWDGIIPSLSGWIEVDPFSGKPLLSDHPRLTNLPNITNLQTVQQRPLDESSS